MLLVHTGNRVDALDRAVPRFPTSQIDAVTAVIARLLVDLGPSSVVSAPANGADLIILGEAQRLGIDTHVLVPLPIDMFERGSVAHPSHAWTARYRAVLASSSARPGSSVDTFDLSSDPEWYLTANDRLLDRAAAVRHASERVVAVTVRPADGESPPSVSDRFHARSLAAGLTVLTIDPRPGRTGGVLVG